MAYKNPQCKCLRYYFENINIFTDEYHLKCAHLGFHYLPTADNYKNNKENIGYLGLN